jgi:hypothetical protein
MQVLRFHPRPASGEDGHEQIFSALGAGALCASNLTVHVRAVCLRLPVPPPPAFRDCSLMDCLCFILCYHPVGHSIGIIHPALKPGTQVSSTGVT